MSAVKIEHLKCVHRTMQAGTLEVGGFFYLNQSFDVLFQKVGYVKDSRVPCLEHHNVNKDQFTLDSGILIYPVRVKIIVEGFES